MLPDEHIKNGLENFFKDTLEKNGKGKRADVDVPVPAYGSEFYACNNISDCLLSGINYGLWFHDQGVIYPVVPSTSQNQCVWNNQWPEIGYNAHYDQNFYYGTSFDPSPPSYYAGVNSFTLTNAAFAEENWKSRGIGTFIPNHVMLYFFLFVVLFLYSRTLFRLTFIFSYIIVEFCIMENIALKTGCGIIFLVTYHFFFCS